MSVTIGVRSLFGFATGVAAAIVAVLTFQAMTADAVQPGESTFVPVTPCRLFDTRPGVLNVGPRSTPLPAGTPVVFQVTGKNGQCPAIPAAATAVSINLTGLNASAVTNLRMYPANASVPNAAVLNMTPGQGATPNKLDVKLSPDGKIAIYNERGSINVIGDVMGYYRADGIADLAARVTALEAKVAALQAKTASMSK